MNPFLGQLMLTSFNFPPKGFALCNGQLLQISQNQALFALLGTTFGGDGRTTFGLPDLRGRIALSSGAGVESTFTLGQRAGSETVTLQTAQLPAHVHIPVASSATPPTQASPSGNAIGAGSSGSLPYGTSPNSLMAPAAVTTAGGGQAHENRQPYLVLSWCVATQGIFPSQN